jgi:mevalonate kinase
VGLGSSAALAVAGTRALAELLGVSLPPARLLEVAGRAEDIFHGRASGIDVAAAALGGVLRFRRGQPVCPVRLATPLSLVVAVMEPSPPTAALVESVAVQRRRKPRQIDALLAEIGQLARRAEVLLETGEPARLGPLLDRNHELLRSLGLSSPALERGRKAARAAGALGVKLTGAGGGGCLIALVKGTANPVRRAFHDAGGLEVLEVQVGTT